MRRSSKIKKLRFVEANDGIQPQTTDTRPEVRGVYKNSSGGRSLLRFPTQYRLASSGGFVETADACVVRRVENKLRILYGFARD